MSSGHRQMERWLLSQIKQLGNTSESSGRVEEQYNQFIEECKREGLIVRGDGPPEEDSTV